MLCVDISDIAIISEMHINKIRIKSRAYSYYFDNLIKANKLEIKNILIDEKSYRDLVIYFTRYIHKINKNVKFVLSWINWKDWKTWGKKFLMVNDYMLNEVLDKIKETMSIEHVDDTKILT